jgi:dihydroorotase/N-acyl-D-amino-acid deacylase
MRDEATRVVGSVAETIAIGEQGRLPTQVTHHKIIGRANWGRSVDTLRPVDEARVRGVDVTIDQYPYTASSTSIQAALLKPWAQEGGRDAVRERLADPAARARIRRECVDLLRDERGGGDPKNVVIARCEWDASLAGKNLADLTRTRGHQPTLENAADTVLWIVEQGGCQGVFHAIQEDDLRRILRHPATMVASDGEVTVLGRAHPHPRSYGTFARVLAVYVRDQHVLALEEAVRKMTALPAQRLGLADRGLLKPGMKADLAVWDPTTVRDAATFDQPHQYAEGFAWVVVNGQVVYEGGRMTEARPGRVLYGPAYVARPSAEVR